MNAGGLPSTQPGFLSISSHFHAARPTKALCCAWRAYEQVGEQRPPLRHRPSPSGAALSKHLALVSLFPQG